MQVIPLTAKPSQQLRVSLGGQSCAIAVYQKSTGLFFDLTLSGVPVATAVLCRDRVNLVRAAYRGFVGKLAFVDTQGTSDPAYAGLGSRFILCYSPS